MDGGPKAAPGSAAFGFMADLIGVDDTLRNVSVPVPYPDEKSSAAAPSARSLFAANATVWDF